jgi:hypothetical protein
MFEVRRLTKQTWADLEELFDLSGGSIVRGCWCIYYRKAARSESAKSTGPGPADSCAVLGERFLLQLVELGLSDRALVEQRLS